MCRIIPYSSTGTLSHTRSAQNNTAVDGCEFLLGSTFHVPDAPGRVLFVLFLLITQQQQ